MDEVFTRKEKRINIETEKIKITINKTKDSIAQDGENNNSKQLLTRSPTLHKLILVFQKG